MKPVPTIELLPVQTQGDAADPMVTVSLEQVAQLSGVGTADLIGLVDYGVLTPDGDPWSFRLDCVVRLQRAEHLRQDLALDDHGFALAMLLLGQITDLEDELRSAQTRSRSPRAEGRLEVRANWIARRTWATPIESLEEYLRL